MHSVIHKIRGRPEPVHASRANRTSWPTDSHLQHARPAASLPDLPAISNHLHLYFTLFLKVYRQNIRVKTTSKLCQRPRLPFFYSACGPDPSLTCINKHPKRRTQVNEPKHSKLLIPGWISAKSFLRLYLNLMEYC